VQTNYNENVFGNNYLSNKDNNYNCLTLNEQIYRQANNFIFLKKEHSTLSILSPYLSSFNTNVNNLEGNIARNKNDNSFTFNNNNLNYNDNRKSVINFSQLFTIQRLISKIIQTVLIVIITFMIQFSIPTAYSAIQILYILLITSI
jgi:hypothetical protein